MEPSADNGVVGDSFMGSYSDALSEELKTTTLNKSFVRANEQAVKKDEVSYTKPINLFSSTFFLLYLLLKYFNSSLLAQNLCWLLFLCQLVPSSERENGWRNHCLS